MVPAAPTRRDEKTEIALPLASATPGGATTQSERLKQKEASVLVGCSDASGTGSIPSPPSVVIIPQTSQKEINLAIESGKKRNEREFVDDGNTELAGCAGRTGVGLVLHV